MSLRWLDAWNYTERMKNNILIFSLIVLTLLVRITFLQQTGYIAEDAHITFQFARNLARGDGFSLNPGQPIYGSTTPLLTILLAAFWRIFGNMVAGARIFGILGVAGGVWFLWKSFRNKYAATLTLVIIALSARLYVEEMSGMEMPLLFLFLAGSYYGYIKDKPILTGILAGLMLWTRIDSIVWVGCLLTVWFFQNKKSAFRAALVATGVYLPWLAFAWLYFGSPIPFTIIAKQVAYPIDPYARQLWHIVTYLSVPVAAGVLLSGMGILKASKGIVLALFVVVETAVLVASGSTFFDRYFYLLTIVAYILLGIGLDRLLRQKQVWVYVAAILCIGLFSYPKMNESFINDENLQAGRHQLLMDIGLWLHSHAPQGSTVLLEPLGYVGWYADRIMFDEVGLATPLAVELHRQGIMGSEFFKYFHPDYVLWTCQENGATREEIAKKYNLIKIFDAKVSRGCYELWKADTYAGE